MRYTVRFGHEEVKQFDDLTEAVEAVVNDPEGSRYGIHDNQEQRWLRGEEIILAYVFPRKVFPKAEDTTPQPAKVVA